MKRCPLETAETRWETAETMRRLSAACTVETTAPMPDQPSAGDALLRRMPSERSTLACALANEPVQPKSRPLDAELATQRSSALRFARSMGAVEPERPPASPFEHAKPACGAAVGVRYEDSCTTTITNRVADVLTSSYLVAHASGLCSATADSSGWGWAINFFYAFNQTVEECTTSCNTRWENGLYHSFERSACRATCASEGSSPSSVQGAVVFGDNQCSNARRAFPLDGLTKMPAKAPAMIARCCTDSFASDLSRNLLLDIVISFKYAKNRSVRCTMPRFFAVRAVLARAATGAVLARAAPRAARLPARRPDEDARQGSRHDRTVRHCPPRLPRPSQPEPLRTLPSQGPAYPEHNAAITTSDISAGPLQDYGKQGPHHWRTECMRPADGAQQLTKPPPSSGHAGLGRGEQRASAALSGHVPHWLAVCVLAAFCLWCAKDWIRSRLRDASVNGEIGRAHV